MSINLSSTTLEICVSAVRLCIPSVDVAGYFTHCWPSV